MMRGILLTARRISFLTCNCLDFYLQKFRQCDPQIPADPDYSIGLKDGTGCEWLHLQRFLYPEMISFPVEDMGKPVWSEEQIISRAFWRIQLVKDLERALKNRTITDWPLSEIHKLNSLDIVEIYDFEEIGWLVATVDFEFRHLSASQPGDEYTTEHSAVMAALEYMARHDAPNPPRWWSRSWPLPAMLPRDIEQAGTDSDVLDVSQSCGRRSYSNIFQTCHTSAPSVVLYRRLGFFIWSEERLNAHGFGRRFGSHLGRYSMLTWLSIVPEAYTLKLESIGV